MAQRRMFSLRIVDTDDFLNMPLSTRLLYYDLAMRADDDGFVDSPKKILKIIGATEDDMHILIAKKYVFHFDSGICVIKDWKIHNYIQKDRYQATLHQTDLKKLEVNEHGAYEPCTQNVYKMDTQDRLGKDRLGKDRLEIDNKASTKVDYSVLPVTNEELKEIKRIRKKNKGSTITQRVANTLGKEFHAAIEKGYTVDDILNEWEYRGWKSLKADWLEAKKGSSKYSKLTERNIANIKGGW